MLIYGYQNYGELPAAWNVLTRDLDKREKLFGARDSIGISPCTMQMGETFLFGSEIKLSVPSALQKVLNTATGKTI